MLSTPPAVLAGETLQEAAQAATAGDLIVYWSTAADGSAPVHALRQSAARRSPVYVELSTSVEDSTPSSDAGLSAAAPFMVPRVPDGALATIVAWCRHYATTVFVPPPAVAAAAWLPPWDAALLREALDPATGGPAFVALADASNYLDLRDLYATLVCAAGCVLRAARPADIDALLELPGAPLTPAEISAVYTEYAWMLTPPRAPE